MKKDNIIILLISISFFSVLIFYAAYAATTSFDNIANLSTNTVIGNYIALTSSGGGNFAMAVSMDNMAQANNSTSNSVATGSTSATIKLQLDTAGTEAICCDYNLSWTWNTSSHQYTITSGATKEFTLTGTLTTSQYANSSGTMVTYTDSKTSRSITETQVPNYSTSATNLSSTTLKICNNASTLSKKVTHLWTIQAKFYNLSQNQDALKGKNLIGSVKVNASTSGCKKA